MQKALIGVIIAAMILTIPSWYQRIQAEESSKKVETIVPYKLLHQWMAADPDLTLEQALSDVRGTGVQSVSLEPDTVQTLETKGRITTLNAARMREHLLLNNQEPLDDYFDRAGLFVNADADYPFADIAASIFEETRNVEVNGYEYTFISGTSSDILAMTVGYDEEAAAEILAAGMNVVPRIGNYKTDVETERILDELLALKQDGIEKILFSGPELPLSGEPEVMKQAAADLKDAGYSVFSIELSEQIGFAAAAYAMDLDVVRLHSVPVTEDTITTMAERIVRAVKERNIRAIFLNLNTTEREESMDVLNELKTEVDRSMPASFERGKSETFVKYEAPLWQKLVGLIGAGAFLALGALALFKKRWLALAAIAGTVLLALLYAVLGTSLILKAAALAVGLAAPMVAVLHDRNESAKGFILKEYIKALAVTFVGIWFIIVLLNGNEFLLGIDSFRGVKLIYIVPIAAVLLYAIWEYLIPLMKESVKYWHVALLGIIAVLGLYYIGRTGNEGSVSNIEVQARLFLEKILYVRPRTKEFLIGFPLFILALHIGRTYKMASYFLLVGAVIGFLSMVNTFTHLHIPLSISLLRSLYSIILGLIIGYALILLYNWAGKRAVEKIKARWQG
ncbi:DUF5693 family protein [Planococcus koreensis]|uniref:DUF5693 family protein n=1 Tax=Planococcus koreensis TaxID=112331 RepID=UPI0039FD6CA1